MILKYLSYPRSVISGVLVLMWTFLWSVLTLLGVFIFNGAIWWGDFICRNWAYGLLYLFSIRLEMEGLENISDKNGIFVFNHSSHFDIPIIYVALKSKTVRFGAKAELFKIPFFGVAMKSIGVLEIHRSKREKVIDLYKESLKNLEQGYNYILAPEGTRQSSGELGEFKMGPFVMAISGQCPITPVVLIGAQKIMPKHSLFPSWGHWWNPVKVKILPPIETSHWTMENRQDLRDKVREQMSLAFYNSSGPRDG